MPTLNPSDPMKRKSSNRSVNDFHTSEALRNALLSMGHRGPSCAGTSWSDFGFARHPSIAKSDVRSVDYVVPFLQASAVALSRITKLNRSNHSHLINDEEVTTVKTEPELDLRRLAVLKSYRVIGSGRNPTYERLVSLTSRIFKAPIAYISVLDLSMHQLLAARGLGATAESKQDLGVLFASKLVEGEEDIVVVPDLSKNDLFKDHENVAGYPNLRFYAGTPLICPEGYRLGTLCVLDFEPRPDGLSLDMKQNLREIADMIIDAMVEEREKRIFEYRQPSQIIACTSNDLMTPLMGVVRGLKAIQDDEKLLNSLTALQKEGFNTAFSCSTIMSRICRKSLESFCKNQNTVNESTIQIGRNGGSTHNLLKIQELVRHLKVVMDPFPKRVPLVITVFDDVPPVLVADDLKVFRSIVNYLTNACANTDTGSVHLKIFLKDDSDYYDLDDVNAQQSVVFLVEDTGNGISVDRYHSLFKPIVVETTEMDASCTLASFGDGAARSTKTGLGLYSVATQIDSIGGKFGFRPRGFSENGSQLYDEKGRILKGSIFWFSIPFVVPDEKSNESLIANSSVAVVESDDDDDTTHDKRKWNVDDEAALDEDFSRTVTVGEKRTFENFVGGASGTRRKKALLIDDSLVTRRNISRMLRILGFDVVEAINGLEGLKELQTSLFDLVLCDFLMPVMDGTECVQQFRQYEAASRPWFDEYIVGFSAHAKEEDVERGLKVGMNDYLSKPVTMKSLEEIIKGKEYNCNTMRLDSILGKLDETNDTANQCKTVETTQGLSSNEVEQALHVCLIVEEGDTISKEADKITHEYGWKLVVVHDSEDALRLLQMRNWDGVLIDDALPGMTSYAVMEHFREWENVNRVNRQKNVYQVNSSFIPSQLETSSTVQLPSGFDGALGKPISAKVLKQFFLMSANGKRCMSHDIIRR